MSLTSSTERPQITGPWLPASAWEWIVEALSLAILLFWVVYLAIDWDALPDKVPTGFGFNGLPRRFGSRAFLWLLPGLGLGIYALLTWLSRKPNLHNYHVQVTAKNAPRIYALSRAALNLTKLEMVALFGYIEWKMLQTARGAAEGLYPWSVPIAVVVMLATSIYPVLRMRQIQDER